eukprot:3096741-Pleurochrysis_carterae.AAC.1
MDADSTRQYHKYHLGYEHIMPAPRGCPRHGVSPRHRIQRRLRHDHKRHSRRLHGPTVSHETEPWEIGADR